MFEYVHNQFAAVVERDAQPVVAVVQPVSLLVGMPVFIGDPFGSGFGKFQYGSVLCGAAKDAIGRGEKLFQLFRVGRLGNLI